MNSTNGAGMRLILLGAPGSGKGTQAVTLAQRFTIEHISTGDVFRDEVLKKTPLGAQVASYIQAGKLVPDQLVLDTVIKRLEQPGCVSGFVLDGFPRTIEQAQKLEEYLWKKGLKISCVFYFDIDESTLIERLSKRRYCPNCPAVYNLTTRPPKVADTCDQCSAKLAQRSDDEPETIRRRLMVYQDLTAPLVAYYKAAHCLVSINANRCVEDITTTVLAGLP